MGKIFTQSVVKIESFLSRSKRRNQNHSHSLKTSQSPGCECLFDSDADHDIFQLESPQNENRSNLRDVSKYSMIDKTKALR